MSAYLTLDTPMFETELLVLALHDLGYGPDKVEVHEVPQSLVGYEGRQRTEHAHVIVRRRHIGGASNDVRFRLAPTGFVAEISGYDRSRFTNGWLDQLHERYAAHEAERDAEQRRQAEERRKAVVAAQRASIVEKARALGYRVRETTVGETIRLQLVRRTY